MPSFICSDYHLSVVAKILDSENAESTARELFEQNVAGYNHDHPDEPYTGSFKFQDVDLRQLDHYQLLKAIDAFNHESLSDPQYETSDLYRRLKNQQVRVVLEMDLPSVDTREWYAEVVNQARDTEHYCAAKWNLTEPTEQIADPKISPQQRGRNINW